MIHMRDQYQYLILEQNHHFEYLQVRQQTRYKKFSLEIDEL